MVYYARNSNLKFIHQNVLESHQTPSHSPNLATILFGDPTYILNPGREGELTSFTSCFMAIPRSHLCWPCLSTFHRRSHLSDPIPSSWFDLWSKGTSHWHHRKILTILVKCLDNIVQEIGFFGEVAVNKIWILRGRVQGIIPPKWPE